MTATITTTGQKRIFKKYIPVLTLTCCLISVVLFIGINTETSPYGWDIYKKWGAPNSEDMFNGSYWGLITSNFLHVELWHIAFNLYWLWIFGKKIEYESSKAYYLLLILSSALVSSLAELSFSSTTGIGLSGIGYALFGFILVKSKTTESYKNYLDRNTYLLFLFWLVFCIVLTQLKTWNVGNAAHISGLLWGMGLAYVSRFARYKQWLAGIASVSLLASSVFWNPMATAWLSHEAFELHKDQRADEAIVIYKKILSRDAENEFAKSNLKQLEIHQLQKKAFDLHNSKKYNEARQVYEQILSMDPADQWAKDNLKMLPE